MKYIGCLILLAAFSVRAEDSYHNRVEPLTQTVVLTEGEIAQVVMTIDDGEIGAAKIAMKNSKNSSVKDFAKMMADAHTKNRDDLKNLAKKEKFALKNSELSKGLDKDSGASNKNLKKVAKNDFDKTYMDDQVNMHGKALSTLGGMLLPSSMNADLRATLEQTKNDVSMHLEKAKSVRAELK